MNEGEGTEGFFTGGTGPVLGLLSPACALLSSESTCLGSIKLFLADEGLEVWRGGGGDKCLGELESSAGGEKTAGGMSGCVYG